MEILYAATADSIKRRALRRAAVRSLGFVVGCRDTGKLRGQRILTARGAPFVVHEGVHELIALGAASDGHCAGVFLGGLIDCCGPSSVVPTTPTMSVTVGDPPSRESDGMVALPGEKSDR